MKKLIAVILLLTMGIFLVGCTENGIESENKGIDTITEESDESNVIISGESYQVVAEGMTFMPTNVEIKVGETVEWVNKDDVDHTVSFENGDFDEELVVGATGTYTFNEIGEHRYFCRFHPGMQGVVIVS